MSCPRPVGALGPGTSSPALVVGGHGCLLASTWVGGGGAVPPRVGRTWRPATNSQAVPGALPANAVRRPQDVAGPCVLHFQMLLPCGEGFRNATEHIRILLFPYRTVAWGVLAQL